MKLLWDDLRVPYPDAVRGRVGSWTLWFTPWSWGRSRDWWPSPEQRIMRSCRLGPFGASKVMD